MKNNVIKAIGVTWSTLVGSFGKFPRKFGNCFSIENLDKDGYKIV